MEELWYNNFEKLKQFKEKHGHCNVDREYKKKDKTFVLWVSAQRNRYTKGTLLDERKILLNQLGFCWDPLEESWHNNFDKLKQFKEEHGHCNVPWEYRKKDKIFVAWVSSQRSLYAKGILPDERKILLNQLGFCWNLKEESWHNNFEKLKQFKEKHGHCNVPREYKEKDNTLVTWVDNQRSKYAKGMLPDEREILLNQLGFCWSLKEDSWSNNFEKLKKFKEKHGHCNVPNEYRKKDKAFVSWIYSQRHRTLTKDRKALLDKLGFCWDVSSTKVKIMNRVPAQNSK